MTTIMSYQNPQLTSAPSLESTLVSSFSQAEPAPHILPAPSTIQVSSRSKSRRGSIAPVGGKIRRSMSTPNAKGHAASESTGTSSADKRRNKLGYHRTSVACGHCRRRKIRCILAPTDAQGRCSNCIRLKKECTFYPVDQQPQVESRTPSEAQARYEADTTSEASPPNHVEHQRGRQDGLQYPSLTMPLDQDRSKTGSYSHSPDDKVYTSPHPYEYTRSPSTWDSASVSKSSTSEIFNSGWRIPGESPITPASAYSPYTPSLQHPSHPTWPSIASEPAPREDVNWTVPNRSMSYGTVEGVPLHNPYPYSQGPIAPRISEAYAPALTTSATSPTTSVGTNSMALDGVSRSGQPTFSMPAWQPYSYGKPPMSSAEAYGGWYGPALSEHNQANLEEGNEGRNFSSSSSIYYPNASQAGR